ncbi:hypothetical protein GGR36_000329 [Niveibacterium umoris]|uniref:Uncharacterized protein n=1 Tax=Niveibacterium umoris TaxID=1193620 RepID=A0A840BBV2_9RHOO|nr:hypothetical protein [Niveibacterium umoris]
MTILKSECEDALADEAIQHGALQLRTLEDCRIECLSQLGPEAILLFAHGLIELRWRNLASPHLRNVIIASNILQIGLDAKERKRDCDERQEHLDNALIVSDCV